MKKQQPSQNLAKKIQEQEQKLRTLATATKTAQSQWETQKRQIAKDTEVTIATAKSAIEKELKAGRKELSELNKKIEDAKNTYVQESEDWRDSTLALNTELDKLKYDKKILLQTNADLNTTNTSLGSEITVRQKEVEELKQEALILKQNLDKLSEDKTALESEETKLTQSIKDKKLELSTLISDFETKKTESETELSILESKKQAQAQEIIENRAEDDKVRDNLANWAKDLEEKDKNLRVREAKVDQQERSVARNYKLLNL